MATLKELAKKPEYFTNGHRGCAGCGAAIVARHVLMATDGNVVVANATGCLEVFSTIFPFTAWNVPFIHNAFENAAATISGVEACYQSLKAQKRYDKEVKFIAFGGDGGTYDIGLQALSGAMERGHDMLYVCYDNGAYMNTGIQRSSATPKGANTTTAPAGKVEQGKTQKRKDFTAILVAHHIPYVAQAVVGDWADLTRKVEKALSIKGPTFINVFQPCRLGWGYEPSRTIEMGRLAKETCFWPVFEVEDGVYKLNYNPKDRKKPITEFLKPQSRFKHLFKEENKPLLEEIQKDVDQEWQRMLKICEAT
ncbi:MAG: pyruvate ferredoxin oxidoreductase [Candidatus Aureabacteria bacterium]|nr:pyruvate ferredoxin oxidoreductase [Candidatus Auribacterota bacterium]MCK5655256.1 pyruvate ferredoxin oxidoreductase [Candidatus Auribacterota bacterium]